MKKKVILTMIICLAAMAVILLCLRLFVGGGEDTWICQNGEWVKHGVPSAPKPTTSCKGAKSQPTPTPTPTPTSTSTSKENENIQVTKPKENEIVSSPLEIEGEAKGSWYFEAVFPVKLLDEKGNVLALGSAQAQGDWMTENFVPFKLKLEFKPGTSKTGTLVLENDNPSGLPENAKKIEIPVQF
jgi:hypothetical protein